MCATPGGMQTGRGHRTVCGGLTPLAPTMGPEASSVKPPRQGFMSVPWRAVQQPPFTRWWCPGGPGRRALAGWVITMVPGSARFSPVAPGDRDCYFPPFMEKQTEACRGREPRWRYQGCQGARHSRDPNPGSQVHWVPRSLPTPKAKCALPHCLCAHSLSLAERGRREETGPALPGLP